MIVSGIPDIWYFYHYDVLGNVVTLCDEGGAIVEFYSYDVFGKCTVHVDSGADLDWLTLADNATQSESALDNPYLFTGRRFDPESELNYYRASVSRQGKWDSLVS